MDEAIDFIRENAQWWWWVVVVAIIIGVIGMFQEKRKRKRDVAGHRKNVAAYKDSKKS